MVTGVVSGIGTCRHCGAVVAWVNVTDWSAMPLTVEPGGVRPHKDTCPAWKHGTAVRRYHR
jgi:hypothetical protein